MINKSGRIEIANRKIGTGCPVFIVAEAGVNHNGSLRIARMMVDAARSSGADAVKFQTYKTLDLATADCPKAAYQKKAGSRQTQFSMLKSLELSEPDFEDLFEYCRKKKIMFLSTPFDTDSAEFLYRLGVPAFKVSSCDVTNLPFLKKIASYNRPVILSTGMSDMAQVRDAVKCITSTGNRKLVLLQCTSNYPARFEDVNLRAMVELKNIFKVPTGYSDHTLGIEVAIAAAALGAAVIEKHFTLDSRSAGPDHESSIEPAALRDMVKSIRHVEKSLGDGSKRPQGSELAIAKVVRKSIVADMDIPKGTEIRNGMLSAKRPGTGIEPKFLSRVVGSVTKIDIKKDSILKWGMF